jgi:hypothetical protein
MRGTRMRLRSLLILVAVVAVLTGVSIVVVRDLPNVPFYRQQAAEHASREDRLLRYAAELERAAAQHESQALTMSGPDAAWSRDYAVQLRNQAEVVRMMAREATEQRRSYERRCRLYWWYTPPAVPPTPETVRRHDTGRVWARF